MARKIDGSSGFATNSLYPEPPLYFDGARFAKVQYEADPETVKSMLPPGVELAGDKAICEFAVTDYPSSAVGPYLEAYIVVRVTVDGTDYWYQPCIFTDREAPLASGREIWGYKKKLGTMQWREEGEQILFTVERPVGKRIATFTMTRDRIASPEELVFLPILSLKHIPSSEGGNPLALELVRLDPEGELQETAGVGGGLWAGRGSVSFDSESQVDPWYLFRPTKILSAHSYVLSMSLDYGTIVKNYLEEGSFD